MSLGSENIFTKLRPDDAFKLFNELAVDGREFLCKEGEGENLLTLTVQSREADWRLVCHPPMAPGLQGAYPKSLMLSTQSGDEKFFLLAEAHLRQDRFLTLKIDPEIYKLQRRQHFRLRIPDSYKAVFQLLDLNGKPHQLKAKIQDLSEGGCLLFLPHNRPELKAGDRIEGEFQMGSREALRVKGEVRHIKVEPSSEESQIVGLQFSDLTPAFENRLFSLVMDLHREIKLVKRKS